MKKGILKRIRKLTIVNRQRRINIKVIEIYGKKLKTKQEERKIKNCNPRKLQKICIHLKLYIEGT